MQVLDCGARYTANATNCPENGTLRQSVLHETTLERVVELYLISLMCMVGLFGNSATVIVLRKDKERREALLLLQVLALADGLYLLAALFRYPLKYLVPEYEYNIMQPIVFPSLKVFQTICIWMMVLVTIDRYIYVCKPLRAQVLFNSRTRRWFAVAVFIIGVLYNLPWFLDSCIMQFYDPCVNHTIARMITRPMFNSGWYYDVYRHGCFLVLIYFVPLSILTVLNCLLIRAIKHSTRRHRDMANGAEYNENNATVVLIIIVLVFIACETPELLLRIFNMVQRKADIQLFGPGLMRFTTVSELLMVINSSINFFIYFAYGRRFRRVMKETFVVKFTTSGTVLTPESVPLHRQPINIARINHMLHNHVNHVKTHACPTYRPGNQVVCLGNHIPNHNMDHERRCNENQANLLGNQPNRHNNVNHLDNAHDNHVTTTSSRKNGDSDGNDHHGNNEAANGNHGNCDQNKAETNENNCNQLNHG